MTSRTFPWSRLGIDPTPDKAAIRKAYADALRSINPDEDIAGFADLRRARDSALWMADQQVHADTPGDAQADEGELYGLGVLDDEDEAFGAWEDDDADPRWDATLAPAPAHAPELTEAQQRAQKAWERLLEVLYPSGEPSDDAVTHTELDDGLAALATLIARAEEADIEEHDALDGALAELFARTWPRSAPFVEPANAAFHWIGEAGSLDERYSLRFLNDRLRGMRFHEKVQQPGHPLHKAWAELSRPGKAGMLDRLRVKRLDVHKLLVGIRERYPELEAHLDAQRVASWEGSGEGASNARTGFKGALIFVLLFFALMRGLAALIGPDDGGGSTASREAVNAALIDARLSIAAAEAFGPGTDLAMLRKADPALVDQWRRAVGQGSNADVALAVVRGKALQSGAVADFDGLVARAELRRLWLAAARPSPDQCRQILRGDFTTTPLTLSQADRKREQSLLKRLLEAKYLSSDAQQKGGTFSVPGWVLERAAASSKLPPEAVRAALSDPDHASRCALEYAMLGAILEQPGKVPVELLRGL
ncbi:MAG: hypothetical protein KAF27_03250 [Porphyrobacter sp.]|nr:hypothetical protein [Porphyrobacter sp.]